MHTLCSSCVVYGCSGVGKTELAKALAVSLFNAEESMASGGAIELSH